MYTPQPTTTTTKTRINASFSDTQNQSNSRQFRTPPERKDTHAVYLNRDTHSLQRKCHKHTPALPLPPIGTEWVARTRHCEIFKQTSRPIQSGLVHDIRDGKHKKNGCQRKTNSESNPRRAGIRRLSQRIIIIRMLFEPHARHTSTEHN